MKKDRKFSVGAGLLLLAGIVIIPFTTSALTNLKSLSSTESVKAVSTINSKLVSAETEKIVKKQIVEKSDEKLEIEKEIIDTNYTNETTSGSADASVDTKTITFDSNRGTLVESQTLQKGEKATRPADPKFPGYKFDGWYSDKNLTKAFNFNTTINNDITLYAKWRYQGVVNDLNVYFIKDEVTIDHFTIMDRNLGASEVYNQNYENPNTASYGYYYQWGNNYGFSNDLNDNTYSSEQVPYDTWSKYIPSKYASSNFVIGTQKNFYNWMEGSTSTDNIWGGRSDNTIDKQGPCPTGYHVPSKAEWEAISKYRYKEREWDVAYYSVDGGGKNFASVFLLPIAGYIAFESSTGEEPPVRKYQGNWATYRASTNKYHSDANNSVTDSAYDGDSLLFGSINSYLIFEDNARANGASVRCFKDTVSPEITIYQNGGKNAIIAVDGDKITTLQSPTRDDGKVFEGWYADQGFTQRIKTGSTVPNELFAKWEGDSATITHEATLLPGNSFNEKIKSIAGDKLDSIQSIKRANNKRGSLTDNNLISENGSEKVRAWIEYNNYTVSNNIGKQGILYYYTETNEIYLNEDSSKMFEGFTKLSDISALADWNTSKVTDMSYMFLVCSSLKDISPLAKWDTSKVTDMGRMFRLCSSLTDLSALANWDTSKVTDMKLMFYECSSLKDISPLAKWDTSKVTDMGSMFEGCSGLTNISTLTNWNTSKVTDMAKMFIGCSSLKEIDLSNWNTSNVTNMAFMFKGCSNLEKIYASDKFTVKNIKNSAYMFSGAAKLVGGNGTKYDANHTDKEYARIDKPGQPGYFTDKTGSGDSLNFKFGTISIANPNNPTEGITIMDRNLGATNTGAGKNAPIQSYGYYYQWGNNYGFFATGSVKNTSSSQVDASQYGPKNPYSNPIFITRKEMPFNWDSSNNNNLWGGLNDENEYVQGPCPEGYHIPSINEWSKVLEYRIQWYNEKNRTSYNLSNSIGKQLKYIDKSGIGTSFSEYFKIPYAGALRYGNASLFAMGERSDLWTRSPSLESSDHAYFFYTFSNSVSTVSTNHRSFGHPIRCFKNTYEPESTHTGNSSFTGNSNGRLIGVDQSIHNAATTLMTGFTAEEIYQFAYENGLTTANSIDKANLSGNMTRGAMAKMLSYYAINVLGQTPDLSMGMPANVSQKTNEEYNNGIVLAYQLRIMGQNSQNFRPYAPITKAHFVTALSRMLYGTEDGNPYYKTHMTKLYNEGILGNTQNPNSIISRGAVMEMLIRASSIIE